MNKCIKYLAIGLVAMEVGLSSYAANIGVTWGASDSTGVLLADGVTLVPSGSLVMIGTFSVAPAVGTHSLANFIAFGQGAMGNGTSLDGFWYDTTTANEAVFAHKQAYIVVVSTPTLTTTQLGIFAFDMSIGANWRLPASTDVPNSTILDLQDMVNNPGTPGATLKSGAEIIYGSGPAFGTHFATFGPESADGQMFFQLAAIPEPTSIMLVSLGLLGTLGFMRRRRR